MNNYNTNIVIKTAMLISAYIFVRPSELARSEWSFIDFDKSHWFFDASIMKMGRDHLVPFPRQVKLLLKALYPIAGHSKYIFPSERDSHKPIHNETVNKALKRIEQGKYVGRMTSHGFRSMASTILNENQFRADIIEKQLAHQEKNRVRGAYNHAEYLRERTEMMQWYADHQRVEDYAALYDAKDALRTWVENAQAIKAHYITEQGLSRLFAKDKSHQSAPVPLVYENDQLLYQQLLAKVIAC